MRPLSLYASCRPTPRLTGAGSRRLEGTPMGHQNREAMAHGGVRVERQLGWGAEALYCLMPID